MTTENLLIELGTEELPPKALRKLAEAFANGLDTQLVSNHFNFEDLNWLASPRRLAIKVNGLQLKQADQNVEKKGPSVQAAFDAEGNPSKAAEGWARSNGITVDQAERLKTDKGEWLLFKTVLPGKSVTELLNEMITAALNTLPIPKPMRWGNKKTQFIRPVHTVTVLLGSEVVDVTVLDVASSNVVRGHRFHGNQDIEITSADTYEQQLESEYVIADFEKRKAKISQLIQQTAAKHGATVEDDNELLEEVTGLVEWPVALVASFEESFLQVPKEALIYTMKDDQKYFPLMDNEGNLLPKFIFISNIESKDPQVVVSGNEKVVRPRLADAQFFFDTDRQKTLEQHSEKLSTIVFQKQLGTVQDKSLRVSELAKFIASLINADQEKSHRAGLLSKADLVTSMVYEFPDVQGIMGMHYAINDGEDAEVANALNEQYMPRYSGDKLPESLVSCAVSLAEKFDTLVGIFGIGQTPKGDKDPFALRRAAIGSIRILVEKELSLDITKVIEKAVSLYAEKLSNKEVTSQVFEFILARFKAFYQEQGLKTEIINSVEKLKPVSPLDFDYRVKAVQNFLTLEESSSLAAANKRVSNILNKQKAEIVDTVNTSLLQEDSEKTLFSLVDQLSAQLQPMFQNGDYTQALVELSKLKEPVDAFFDNVMVMADDNAVKNNRLAMLSQLRGLFLNVADISELG